MLDLEQTWELAKAWYRGREAPGWRGRDVEEVGRVVRGVGLEGDFWAIG